MSYLSKLRKKGVYMFNFKSLYFRMTVIHYTGMIILPLNAYFFTNDSISKIIQIVIAVALIFHELDENKNGKQLSKALIHFLKNMDKKDASLSINTSMASEYSQIKEVVDQRDSKQKIKEQEELLFIQEAKNILQQVRNGVYDDIIQSTTTNQSLEEFKKVVNEMILDTKTHFSTINTVLHEYTHYDYRTILKLQAVDPNGEFNRLAQSINHLKDAITHMLLENKKNGETLQMSSAQLLQNASTLNSSSQEATKSLENTRIVLEQITYNVSDTSDKTIHMSQLANEVIDSAQKGEQLATKTFNSMDEINSQVNSINEAVTIIDQIAFQTNILSLNAAVEAATASEAGKGFAVVAQEVRNLANRSTEAAKEIKRLVESANNKATEGKSIANEMIERYHQLNGSIDETMTLINQVANTTQEQKDGIVQINTAVDILEEQIRANSEVSSQSNTIATKTSYIATTVVNETNKKEFEGKNQIQTTQRVA